jgi:hypothetical protein
MEGSERANSVRASLPARRRVETAKKRAERRPSRAAGLKAVPVAAENTHKGGWSAIRTVFPSLLSLDKKAQVAKSTRR